MWSFLLLYRSSLITWDPICQSLALFSKQYTVLAYAAILKRFCAPSSIGDLGLPLALLPVNTQSQYTVTMDLQDTPDPFLFGTVALSLGMLQFFLVCGEVDTLCSICGKRHSVGAGVHMCRREARGLCQVPSLTASETWSLTELSAHWLARMAAPPLPSFRDLPVSTPHPELALLMHTDHTWLLCVGAEIWT